MLNNQTPYALQQISTDSNECYIVSANWLEPGSVGTIYFEIPSHRQGDTANASVTYMVHCPDGQTDSFRINVKKASGAYEFAEVSVSAVEHEPHCIYLLGNDNLMWSWNELGSPAPTIKIYSLEHNVPRK